MNEFVLDFRAVGAFAIVVCCGYDNNSGIYQCVSGTSDGIIFVQLAAIIRARDSLLAQSRRPQQIEMVDQKGKSP